jgi:hypothetical protein
MRRSGPRTTAKLSESVQRHLNMYALAAGAAGMGLLASQPAEAKIVYTKASVHLGTNQHYDLDLNHDGLTDFSIWDIGKFSKNPQCTPDEPWIRNSLVAGGTYGNRIEGSRLARALVKDMPIGHSQPFGSSFSAQMAVEVHGFGSTCRRLNVSYGDWIGVTGRYLGLMFQIKGRTHYGWARLNVKVRKTVITATLLGYTYETIPGKSIKAGQTNEAAVELTDEDFGPDASLTNPIPDKPQVASLGALARGAPGLAIWRRREQPATTK